MDEKAVNAVITFRVTAQCFLDKQFSALTFPRRLRINNPVISICILRKLTLPL